MAPGGRTFRNHRRHLARVPDDLGEWLEEQFGARDERLVTDLDLEPSLEAAGPAAAGSERVRAEMDDLSDRFRAVLEQASTPSGTGSSNGPGA
jgi:hypothetical protein